MVWYVLDPATSEAGARWPIFWLVVVATTSRRDNKDQMIRPYGSNHVDVSAVSKLATSHDGHMQC
jgi:hypothetical protein